MNEGCISISVVIIAPTLIPPCQFDTLIFLQRYLSINAQAKFQEGQTEWMSDRQALEVRKTFKFMMMLKRIKLASLFFLCVSKC